MDNVGDWDVTQVLVNYTQSKMQLLLENTCLGWKANILVEKAHNNAISTIEYSSFLDLYTPFQKLRCVTPNVHTWFLETHIKNSYKCYKKLIVT